MPQSLRVQKLWWSVRLARPSEPQPGRSGDGAAVVLSAAVFTAASPVDLRSVASIVGDVAGRALADVAEAGRAAGDAQVAQPRVAHPQATAA